MNTSRPLFDTHSDWLAHTLACAGQECPETSMVLHDGTRILRKALGVLWITPPDLADNRHREALMVSAGIHGNETAPIEVLNGLVSELLEGRWSPGCPLLLILGNPPAMVAGERFTGVNLNRLFNGAHGRKEYRGEPEADRARLLEGVCRAFADTYPELALSHYDLHTAIRPSRRERFALYPYLEGRSAPPREQCDFLLEAEVETLLLQHKESTVFSAFSASELNAESFTIELGKVRPFGQNDLSRFGSIKQALRRRFQGQIAPGCDHATGQLTVFEVVHEILNTGDGFRFHIPDDVANFTEYSPGTVIWEDDQTRYQVGSVPEAIVFPNREVPVGHRVGLLVRPAHSPARAPAP
ncbi:succinylglutamate desuccinylase [Marinobacter oulmenensis]|uniref:Succinylglutamate desuccinylase n=1 Tax=Marinobacter oulmenensis TaxID=643747 RepID=A0A840U9W8_9GAMM|nr:succinylglutamate desuccinylase [Marinobacter oulmenensis]MBB5319940.1 succinylglutamate desuccinylase [Marinobacter oulmenensis]